MSTDSIADTLVKIKNALPLKAGKVDVPASKIKLEIARILKEEKFIANYKYIPDHKQGILRIYLKYDAKNNSLIQGIKRVSKPGKRVYKSWQEISPILSGTGIAIISTSKGVLTDKQCREQKIGGEIICYVW